MNFAHLLLKLDEARVATSTPKTGESMKKERLKSNATDNKSKDAARKRAERARQIPREKKSKQELIKEVILVKTSSGRVQLIFKDSYDKQRHEIVSKEQLSIEEAQQATKDPKFEQTRASQLLFGDVKTKEPSKKEGKKEEEKGEVKKKETKKEEGEEEKPRKGKRMSKEDIFKAMSQMNGEQLAQMPLEMRQEYFKMTRKPPSNVDFDNMSYEALSVKFNISPISNLPYNQQVLNALMFLAKLKAGAGEQEMQTYAAMAPTATEFTRTAFFTARKILSQIGDECIQNLVSNVETGTKSVNSEGAVDMECGNYKFKISAGGEIALSSTQFDQTNKSFKGLVGNALMQSLNNSALVQNDPKLSAMTQQGAELVSKFSTMLIPDEMLGTIMQDEKLVNQLKSMKLRDSQGNDLGPAIDENGELNPAASLSKYQEGWLEAGKSLLKGARSAEKSPLKTALASILLKSMIRGDNMVQPEMAPNHLVTVNGVFPLTDEYFDTIAQSADLEIKPAKDIISTSNIGSYKASAAEKLKKFSTIVEAKQEKVSLKDMLVDIKSINPMEFIIKNLMNNNDFSLNASLLPGFSPKDLNSVQYNYVRIGKKTVKIPVENSEKITTQMLGEAEVFVNDIMIEALTNNFVLSAMVNSGVLTEDEASLFEAGPEPLLEETEDLNNESIMKRLYERVMIRVLENPEYMHAFLDIIEEYKRDYKKEYKNYHGKAKQRKERAARTAARELMIKKGRVKKGDGKDIDHKKPLRNGGSKGINNLRVRDKSENRSDNGHKEGEKQNKGSWK
jgi:hypothetical protein